MNPWRARSAVHKSPLNSCMGISGYEANSRLAGPGSQWGVALRDHYFIIIACKVCEDRLIGLVVSMSEY